MRGSGVAASSWQFSTKATIQPTRCLHPQTSHRSAKSEADPDQSRVNRGSCLGREPRPWRALDNKVFRQPATTRVAVPQPPGFVERSWWLPPRSDLAQQSRDQRPPCVGSYGDASAPLRDGHSSRLQPPRGGAAFVSTENSEEPELSKGWAIGGEQFKEELRLRFAGQVEGERAMDPGGEDAVEGAAVAR